MSKEVEYPVVDAFIVLRCRALASSIYLSLVKMHFYIQD